MTGPNLSREHKWPTELLNAVVSFWCCPVHVGAPHRVEWRDGIAHCLTCGRTSAEPGPRSQSSRSPIRQLRESDEYAE